MRKILASFLATAMVASMGAVMTFAADTEQAKNGVTVAEATAASVTLDMSKLAVAAKDGDNDWADGTELAAGDATLTIEFEGGGVVDYTNKSAIKPSAKASDIAAAFATAKTADKATFTNGTEVAVSALTRDGSKLTLTAGKTGASKFNVLSAKITAGKYTAGNFGFTSFDAGVSTTAGLNRAEVTVDAEGSLTPLLREIVRCDRNGNPIPLTEKPAGVDKDQNGDDGVQSNKTVYFQILPGSYKFDDDTYWKLKITKGDNGKYISAVSDAPKKFANDLYPLGSSTPLAGTGGYRSRYIKVALKEVYSADEYKITLDMRMTPKSKACDVYDIADDAELKVQDFYFYMKNIEKDADNDWKVGINGLMLNPLTNDWNNVTWYDEDGDVAHMKFFADSDTSGFYSKLSTKWEHQDYRSFFNDQDAFLFQFVGTPSISSTSRAELEIYNPFVDEDGNEIIDPATAVIYEIIDGEPVLATDKFEYKEGDNGEMAFATKTRFLGNYVICEHEIDLGDAGATGTPDDVVPEDTAPAPVAPDGGSGAKTPPNTGRF